MCACAGHTQPTAGDRGPGLHPPARASLQGLRGRPCRGLRPAAAPARPKPAALIAGTRHGAGASPGVHSVRVKVSRAHPRGQGATQPQGRCYPVISRGDSVFRWPPLPPGQLLDVTRGHQCPGTGARHGTTEKSHLAVHPSASGGCHELRWS